MARHLERPNDAARFLEEAVKLGASARVDRTAQVKLRAERIGAVKPGVLLAAEHDRLLGSVPADAARRATCDVLIVHTT